MSVTIFSINVSGPKFLGILIGFASLYVTLGPTPVGAFIKAEIENAIKVSEANAREAKARADAAEKAASAAPAGPAIDADEKSGAATASSATVADSGGGGSLAVPVATPRPEPVPAGVPYSQTTDAYSDTFAPPEPTADCFRKPTDARNVNVILTRESTDKVAIVRDAIASLSSVQDVYTTVPGDSCFVLTVVPNDNASTSSLRREVGIAVFASLAQFAQLRRETFVTT